MFLERVAAETRERVEYSKSRCSERALRNLCVSAPPSPSLRRALARKAGESMRVIAEVKRASPSRGPIRPDLVLEDLVAAYARGGASAISVLTEPSFFGGDLSDINRAGKVTDLPLLRKDFIIDGYQLLEARAAGAGAVLLIAALLERERLAVLLEEGRELGLEALVEVHDEVELEAALEAGAEIVGINNRDLKTLRVDLETTTRLAPMVPPDKVLVSESGYSSRAEARKALRAGVHAILVGEALVRRESPEELIAELRAEELDGHTAGLRGDEHGPG